MPEELRGGCKCGWSDTAGRVPQHRCFVAIAGTGHAEMVPLVAGTFSISKECNTFEMTGGSGRPTFSGFCPTCGSQLTRQSERMSDRVYVHAASLDDPSIYCPEKSIYSDAAQGWDHAVIQQDHL